MFERARLVLAALLMAVAPGMAVALQFGVI